MTVFDLMRWQMAAALSAVVLQQRLLCAFWPMGPLCEAPPDAEERPPARRKARA
jgi:hypothetical protein